MDHGPQSAERCDAVGVLGNLPVKDSVAQRPVPGQHGGLAVLRVVLHDLHGGESDPSGAYGLLRPAGRPDSGAAGEPGGVFVLPGDPGF